MQEQQKKGKRCNVCGIFLSEPRTMPTAKVDESGIKISKAYSLAVATFSDDMKKCNHCRDRVVRLKPKCVICQVYIAGKKQRLNFMSRGNFCKTCNAKATTQSYKTLYQITDEL